MDVRGKAAALVSRGEEYLLTDSDGHRVDGRPQTSVAHDKVFIGNKLPAAFVLIGTGLGTMPVDRFLGTTNLVSGLARIPLAFIPEDVNNPVVEALRRWSLLATTTAPIAISGVDLPTIEAVTLTGGAIGYQVVDTLQGVVRKLSFRKHGSEGPGTQEGEEEAGVEAPSSEAAAAGHGGGVREKAEALAERVEDYLLTDTDGHRVDGRAQSEEVAHDKVAIGNKLPPAFVMIATGLSAMPHDKFIGTANLVGGLARLPLAFIPEQSEHPIAEALRRWSLLATTTGPIAASAVDLPTLEAYPLIFGSIGYQALNTVHGGFRWATFRRKQKDAEESSGAGPSSSPKP
jgi:hypothetical protein